MLAQTIYESNHTENEITKVSIVKSTKKNQIYLYAITNINTMKIFEVDLSAFKEPVKELT